MQTPPSLRSYSPDKEDVKEYRARYIDSIPYEFQHLVCQCQSNKDFMGEKKFSFENNMAMHTMCGKYTSLWTCLEVCFSCEEIYLKKRIPDNMMLCEGCGGE